jgi:hypothetical protein
MGSMGLLVGDERRRIDRKAGGTRSTHRPSRSIRNRLDTLLQERLGLVRKSKSQPQTKGVAYTIHAARQEKSS